MHPEYNKERRDARATALQRMLNKESNNSEIRYTDAAKYKAGRYVACITDKHHEIAAASVAARDIEVAEQVAIAMATRFCQSDVPVIVVTDSQAACRHSRAGIISKAALNIIKDQDIPETCIFWTRDTNPGWETKRLTPPPENMYAGKPHQGIVYRQTAAK